MYYAVHMSTTITVRTSELLKRRLANRAASQGKQVSELVREILEDAVAERTVAVRAGHLRGRLELARRSPDSWRSRLRASNWRP